MNQAKNIISSQILLLNKILSTKKSGRNLELVKGGRGMEVEVWARIYTDARGGGVHVNTLQPKPAVLTDDIIHNQSNY